MFFLYRSVGLQSVESRVNRAFCGKSTKFGTHVHDTKKSKFSCSAKPDFPCGGCGSHLKKWPLCHHISETKGVIDLTLPPLPEDEYPLPVRSICLNLFRKTLYRLPPLFAEDGRGLRTANNSKWQPQKTRH